MKSGDISAALKTFVDFLELRRAPYMVIGGIANLVWGHPRLTLDIDVTVWAPGKAEARLAGEMVEAFKAKPPEPLLFASQMRVLPLLVRGVGVDVIFGQLPYDRAAIGRARKVDFMGTRVRVCTAEDLILHKIVSSRAKDRQDVEAIMRIRGGKLNRRVLDPAVKGLSLELARPDVFDFYLSLFPR